MANDRVPGEVETVADVLAYNDECGAGPVSREEYLADAKAIILALDAARGRSRDDTVTLAEALTLLRAAHGEAVTHELHGKIGEFLARFGGAR